MKQNINYIKHHKNINMRLIELDLSPIHISLYNALFMLWNNCGFAKEMSINRNDVMMLSKIGSNNTYSKSLRELESYDILEYKPSHNPLKGSKIELYRFDTTDDIVVHNFCTTSDTTSDTTRDTLYKHLNKETIKLLNNKKNCDLLNSNFSKWLKKEEQDGNIADVKKTIDFSQSVLDCYNNCLKYFPKHVHPKDNLKDWLDTIEKLERIDKIPFKLIEEIVKRTRQDSFWGKNFLSINKLRKKNKEGVKYISVFAENIKSNNNNQKAENNEQFKNYTTNIRKSNPNL